MFKRSIKQTFSVNTIGIISIVVQVWIQYCNDALFDVLFGPPARRVTTTVEAIGNVNKDKKNKVVLLSDY